MFVTYYYEPDSGAAAVRLSRLAKQFHQRGHEVTVLTTMPHYPQGRIHPDYRRKLFTNENRGGIRVIQTWLWATPSRKITLRLISQFSFMLTCILRGLFLPRPDVIFIENQPIPAGLAGWFISRVKRRPYLLNASDFWPEILLSTGVLTENNVVYRVFKSMVNLTQQHADQIVALLPEIPKTIENRIGPVKRVQVIMNAVDLQRFRPELDTQTFREKYQLGDARLITYAGTLGYHLDLETMLQTAAAFENHNDVYFVIIGTGVNRDVLDAKAKHLSRTKWIGWLEHDEMPYAWAASYLTYWAEYDTETIRKIFHAKLFEATASGVPCVVAIEGLVSDIFKSSGMGITVPFGDTQGLINSIQYLLDNEHERQRMSQNARRYAEANFDPDDVANAYEQALKAILP